MNKTYSITWSVARQAWVVTSELSKCGGRPFLGVKRIIPIIALTLGSGLISGNSIAADFFGTVVTSSVQDINNGDTVTSAVINSKGYQNINSGGFADSVNVNRGGNQNVNNGGVAHSTTVENGGRQNVFSEGVASSSLIKKGGAISVENNGSSMNAVVDNGGFLLVSSGGIVSDVNIKDGGIFCADTSTTVSGVNVSGSFFVNNGKAENVRLDGAATFSVLAGHSSVEIMVNSGGILTISDGGQSKDTILNLAGTENVLSGGLAEDTTVNAWATQYVRSGATATGAIVNQKGEQSVMGKAISTVVTGSGTQFIMDGGIATGASINSGGVQDIDQKGLAISTTLNTNSFQYVYSGGSAIDTSVNDTAQQIVETGGVVSGTRVNNGGSQAIKNGAIGISSFISGGGQFVESGGSSLHTVLNSGAAQHVYSGGSASDTYVSSGAVQYVSGGNVVSSTLDSYATLDIQDGIATDVDQKSGATLITNTSVAITGKNAAGSFFISNGVATNVLLENSGILTVFSGNESRYAMVNQKGQLIVDNAGMATSSVISSGGLLNINSGGGTDSTVINTGGIEMVLAGGKASNASVNSGGSQIINSGGGSDNTILNNAGRQQVNSGGVASGTSVGQGGVMSVASFGSSHHAQIANSGLLIASDGSVSTDVLQQSGGALMASTRAQVSGSNSIGSFSIGNGVATGALLENGGRLSVWSGDSAENSVVRDGGVLHLDDGAMLSGSTTIGDGGMLEATVVRNNGDLNYKNSNQASWSGLLEGNGQLRKEGSGVLTLSGTLNQQKVILNDGALVMDNMQAQTSIIAQSGTALSLKNNTTLTGSIDPTDLYIDSSSSWLLTGDSVVDNLHHAGNINFGNQTGVFVPHSLTIANLDGQNGTITLNTVANDSNSPTDKIIIDGGKATGHTNLVVINRGGLGVQTAGNGIAVVETINGGKTDTNAFGIRQPVIAGAYEYTLYRNANENWYLTSQQTSTSNPGVPSLPGTVMPNDSPNYRVAMWNYTAMATGSMDYDKLVAGSSDTRNLPDISDDPQLWSRAVAGQIQHRGAESLYRGDLANSDGSYTFLQLGGDLLAFRSATTSWRAGLYGATGLINNTVFQDSGQRAGSAHDNVYTAGLYGAITDYSGQHVDAILQISHHRIDSDSRDGTGLATSGTGLLASIETAQELTLLTDRGLTIEPQLQYTIQSIKLENAHDEVSSVVWQESLRQDIRAGLKFAVLNDSGTKWWVTPSMTQSFGNKSNIDVSVPGVEASETAFMVNQNGSGVSLDTGVKAQIRKNIGLSARVGYAWTIDGSVAGGYNGQLNLNITF